MKSPKFLYLVLMAKYISKTIDTMDEPLVVRVNYEKQLS